MKAISQPIILNKKTHFKKTNTQTQYVCKMMDSPVGPLLLIASEKALVSLLWKNSVGALNDFATPEVKNHPILTKVEIQLNEYFKGERTTFDIPIDPAGTEFQKNVWKQLSKIPYGKTITYGEQAKRLSKPTASRAVGAANGKNPIGIIVPCHRVVGASGSLTGFAGGIEAKKFLLDLEKKS